MRLLTISTSYPLSQHDGTAPFIRHIERGLTERSHEVRLIVPHHPGLSWAGSDGGVVVEPVRYSPSSVPAVFGYGTSLRSDTRLSKAAIAVAPIAMSAMLRTLNALVASWRPDVVHAHWLLPSGLIAAMATRRGIPLVSSVHGSDMFLATRSRLGGSSARWAASHSVSITVCSRDLADRLTAVGVDHRRIEVIPYGVDVDFFAPSHRGSEAGRMLSFDPPGPVVVAVGRLVAKKGFDVLVDAMQHAPKDTQLVIAGAGDMSSTLEMRAREHGVGSRVHMMGDVDRDQVRELLLSADVVAVPSVVDANGNVDGLPNVLLEAMACGVAVVASKVAGIPDVIEPGHNGLLVAPGDAEELGSAIAALLSNGTARRDLGRNARSTIENSYGWSSCVDRYERILTSAASQ